MSVIESLKVKNILSSEEYKNKLMKLNIQLFGTSLGSGSNSTYLYSNTYPSKYPYTLAVSWKENSYNVSDNTSSVTVSGSFTADQNWWETSHNSTLDIYWYDNKTKTEKLVGTLNFAGLSGKYDSKSKSATFTVTHNSDGKLSGYAKAVFTKGNTTTGYACNSGSISTKTTELYDIPRASSVSCSSPYIGDTATITIGKKSSSFTNTVTYKIGTLTGTLATKTSETVLSLDTESLKEEIYALIPNAKSISGTITCTTYNGSTQVGDPTTANFNLYAKEEECKPIISGTIIDTNESTIALTGDNSIVIKNASKPKVTVNATAQLSSTIKSYSINLNDGQTASEQECTFDTINSSKVIVGATDSRGYTNSYEIDLTDRIVDYLKLHFDNVGLSRPEGTSNEVQLTANGVWYNGKFSEDISNTLTVTFQYKESDSSEWIDGGILNPTINENTFSFGNLSLGDIYDYGKEYQFKIIATDLLNTVGATDKESITVPKGQEVVAIGDDTVWVYGELFLNDTEVLMYDVVEEWED